MRPELHSCKRKSIAAQTDDRPNDRRRTRCWHTLNRYFGGLGRGVPAPPSLLPPASSAGGDKSQGLGATRAPPPPTRTAAEFGDLVLQGEGGAGMCATPAPALPAVHNEQSAAARLWAAGKPVPPLPTLPSLPSPCKTQNQNTLLRRCGWAGQGRRWRCSCSAQALRLVPPRTRRWREGGGRRWHTSP